MKSIRCLFGRHAYYTIREFSSTQRKVGCRRCPGTWGMHDGVKAFVPWDGELEALYSDLDMAVAKYGETKEGHDGHG